MINLRKNYKAFGRGNLKFLNVENPKVLTFTRTYEDQTLLIVINLSKYAQPAEIDLSDYGGYVPVEAFSKNRFPAVPDSGSYFFTLAPHDYQWFVLEKASTEVTELESLPILRLNDWKGLLSRRTRETLETKVLPAYLRRMDWFNGKDQNLQGVTITNFSPVPEADTRASVFVLEVTYERGLPELYQVMVAFVRGIAAEKLTANCPQAVLANAVVGDEDGILCDGLYLTELQVALFAQLTGSPPNTADTAKNVAFVVQKNPALAVTAPETGDVKPKLIMNGQAYAAISYDNRFLLKMYRKVDRTVNPDIELSRYLSETAQFAHVPAFAGLLELRTDAQPIALGMMLEAGENHGDGYGSMLERVDNFIERIGALDQSQFDTTNRLGTLTQPVAFDELPAEVQELLDVPASEQARLLGVRVGELHRALASGTNQKDFTPEPFSLHYQRSLFSGLQSLVRESYQIGQRSLKQLPDDVKPAIEALLARKQEVLTTLKRIYAGKLEATKIRIHGNLGLENVLLTGKDVAIQDFGGDPSRSYSERRLKRSPLRDVVDMIRSFYYVAYEGFLISNQVSAEQLPQLLPFAGFWAHYMSGFFVKAYLGVVADTSFIPDGPAELAMMVDTYLLEQGLTDLKQELAHRPDRVRIPLALIESVIK